ncbi:leucine-rich repeat-containing protein 56 [Acanthochromis polyacanthus]|uniref:leucine-rich repeat-containing protein 56 n=1 Tax=Acanthochromis polyacanthus TaxID=80966 RepID=UPI0022341E45|nr:leucine-rich repeat-containing protein 56 [Acanthochromis polyacanthus]
MSSCQEPVSPELRPGTAQVLVTELSGSGYINPTPASKPSEDSETAAELHLSPDRMKSLCGTPDLSCVTSLEVCVDTQEITLGNFGAYLPKLEKLKMNNSVIMSVRDLGTTLSHLQVLWMSRCCLQDLAGISTLCSLKELYLAYNNVSDVSQVGMLENLQLLDLEGNDVDDLVQVQYLGLCSTLRTLTLEGNPLCLRPNPTSSQMADYSYRAAVRELVPQLRYLDGKRVEEDRLSSCSTEGEDLEIVINSIRDCNSSPATSVNEETADSARPYSRPSSARRPSSSFSCVWPMSSVGSRPNTGSRPMSATRPGVLPPPGSRPGSADSDLAAVEAETSALTHGAGKILFCGNPVQAIRARRERLKTAPTRSTFTPRDLPIHVPEHTYDLEEPDLRERVNVFAELRAWREQHNSRLQAIERERQPQVLTIQHDDDDEETDDDEEEEGFGGMQSDSRDEEHGEDKHCDSLDLQHREALSSDVAQLSLSSDTPLSPSPPFSATAATGNRTLSQSRARRLRLRQANSENVPDFSRVACESGPGTAPADADLILQRVQQKTRTKVPVLPQYGHVPHPPPTSVPDEGLIDSCVEMDLSSVQLRFHKQKMSKILDRPAITRPHTARAALQKHHQHHIQKHYQHHILQPSRGSSQPD